ncbi:MAG: ribosome biogenesis GTPase Der [Bacteroidetes bacterium]|nr:ribosome biogenesis GTPase Der [Bacteroidota bacterium]
MSIVAIVGRPNVGKSTLFNRMVEDRKAIVDDVSGVTRDRHYGKCEWTGTEFTIVDTGGFVSDSKDIFEKNTSNQVLIAVKEADALIFMVDCTAGVTEEDKEFGRILRKSSKPVFLAINKTDNNQRIENSSEFYELGFENIFPIASISGFGTGELLDEIVKILPEKTIEDLTVLPKIAIVGRPNVGKSSLCNALLGEERNIVTDIPGTTRDSINSYYNYYGKQFILTDTAGIRKKGKVNEDIEFYSVMRSIKAIEDSDVILLLIDAKDGIESQDINLFRLAQKNGKGIVIVVNKWDLVEDKETNTLKNYQEKIKHKIAPFTDVPILFISALSKQRIFKAMETALEVFKNLSNKIKTSNLNEVMLQIIENTPPPAVKGKYIKIKYITQLPTKKVSFAFFCNLPQYIPESYKRFLENRLREKFSFSGIPLFLYFRKK